MAEIPAASQAGSAQANQQHGNGQGANATIGASDASKLSGPALWVAIFALAVWLAFSIVLIFNVGTSETEWTRLAWVFGSIQSVAFAAAGALFGTAVQQQNVNSAKQAEATARRDADDQREMASNGRVLAAMMQTDGINPASDDTGGLESLGAGRSSTTDSADAVRQRHAQIARSLFGPVVKAQ